MDFGVINMLKTTIRIFRHRQGLTQKELADRTGLSVLTICRYENGEREPRASDIQKICAALNITEAELFNGPQETKIEIRLVMSFEPMKGGLSALDMKDGSSFTLCVEDNNLGIIGVGPLTCEADIDEFLARCKKKLMVGLSAQDMAKEEG
jgi:predicted transcriptional regulator